MVELVDSFRKISKLIPMGDDAEKDWDKKAAIDALKNESQNLRNMLMIEKEISKDLLQFLAVIKQADKILRTHIDRLELLSLYERQRIYALLESAESLANKVQLETIALCKNEIKVSDLQNKIKKAKMPTHENSRFCNSSLQDSLQILSDLTSPIYKVIKKTHKLTKESVDILGTIPEIVKILSSNFNETNSFFVHHLLDEIGTDARNWEHDLKKDKAIVTKITKLAS